MTKRWLQSWDLQGKSNARLYSSPGCSVRWPKCMPKTPDSLASAWDRNGLRHLGVCIRSLGICIDETGGNSRTNGNTAGNPSQGEQVRPVESEAKAVELKSRPGLMQSAKHGSHSLPFPATPQFERLHASSSAQASDSNDGLDGLQTSTAFWSSCQERLWMLFNKCSGMICNLAAPTVIGKRASVCSTLQL